MKILLYGDSPLATTGLGKLHKILLGHLHDKYDAKIEVVAMNHVLRIKSTLQE